MYVGARELILARIGLIFLICLVAVMGALCQRLLSDDKKKKDPAAVAPAAPVAAAPVAIENRDELVVAFSAAVAEELGTDVSAIRVVSLKQIG